MTINELRKQAYALYLHDMAALHPGVKPVTFAVFCEHVKKGWGKSTTNNPAAVGREE